MEIINLLLSALAADFVKASHFLRPALRRRNKFVSHLLDIPGPVQSGPFTISVDL